MEKIYTKVPIFYPIKQKRFSHQKDFKERILINGAEEGGKICEAYLIIFFSFGGRSLLE